MADIGAIINQGAAVGSGNFSQGANRAQRQQQFDATLAENDARAKQQQQNKLRTDFTSFLNNAGKELADLRASGAPEEAIQRHIQGLMKYMTAPIPVDAYGNRAPVASILGFAPEQIQQELVRKSMTKASPQQAGVNQGATAAAAAPGEAQAMQAKIPAEVAQAQAMIPVQAAQAAATTTATNTAAEPFRVAAENRALNRELTMEQFKAAMPSSAASKERFKQAKDLRGEFTKASSEFTDVRNAYGRILASSNNPSAAGDMALIFNYMKMLDPGSTVREGEFATAQQTTSVPGQVVSAYNRVVNGERMNETQRADFVSRAEDLFAQQRRFQGKLVERYTDLANKFEIKPDLVVSDLEEGLSGRVVNIEGDADYDKLPSGTEFIGPDGVKRRKP